MFQLNPAIVADDKKKIGNIANDAGIPGYASEMSKQLINLNRGLNL
jgi:hypothetical protein